MLLLLAGVAQDAGDEDAAIRLLGETLDVATTGAHARTLPLALERLARLLTDRDPLAAIALFAARENYRDAAGRRPQSEPAAELDALRQATSPAAFESAWQRGSQASLEDLVAIADEAADAALPHPPLS